MRRTVESNRFQVRSDSGKIYVIIEYQEYLPAGTQDNPHAEVEGLKSWRTREGLTVSYIDTKTFQIIKTNETVRKV